MLTADIEQIEEIEPLEEFDQAEQFLLARSSEIAEGTSQIFTVAGREIGVYHRDGEWFAIDNHCPHKGASLAVGPCEKTTVSCPWHHWKFDLRTGEAIGRPGFHVSTHSIEERNGELWVALSDEPWINTQTTGGGEEPEIRDLKAATDEAIDWVDAARCLIRYGAMAWAGYFRHRSDEPLECRHGERVLVETPRGVEVGEVLSSLSHEAPRNDDGRVIKPAGELIRRLNPMETFEQVRLQRDERQKALVQEMLTACVRRVAERQVAVDVVDGELLFDGETFVLYFLGKPSADLGVLSTELAQGHPFKVIFNSVLEIPATSGGCGCSGGGCSTGGGGCGCS